MAPDQQRLQSSNCSIPALALDHRPLQPSLGDGRYWCRGGGGESDERGSLADRAATRRPSRVSYTPQPPPSGAAARPTPPTARLNKRRTDL